MTNKIYIEWDEFHKEVKKLANEIKSSPISFNRIVAVSRGGLIPAGILAYETGIRNCETINVSSYDDKNMREDSKIELQASLQNVDKQTLIIDDLSDSGRTFRMLRKLYPNGTYATVYCKQKGKDTVDIFASIMPDEWIVFPWD